MNKVLRYNTDTGSLGIYADTQSADHNGMPVYTTEGELAAGKPSISELVRFYNSIAPEPVKTFKDKASAARRVWALVQSETVVAEHESTEEAMTEEATTEEAKSGRGRKRGTGEFAGKRLFALKQVNPRRIGTAGFEAYEIIRGKPEGVSYEDYCAAGGRPDHVRWDLERKWVEVR